MLKKTVVSMKSDKNLDASAALKCKSLEILLRSYMKNFAKTHCCYIIIRVCCLLLFLVVHRCSFCLQVGINGSTKLATAFHAKEFEHFKMVFI